MKRDEKRIQALVERAHAVLAETGMPFVIFMPSLGFVRICDIEKSFVIIEEDSNTIYTDAKKRHAQAIIDDFAETLATIRVKTLERNIEDALDRGYGDGSENSC